MEIKTIGIASDHAGFALKQFVKSYLERNGYEYKDYGTYTEESCDYSDYGHALAKGIEDDTFNTMTEIIAEELPESDPVVLSGPRSLSWHRYLRIRRRYQHDFE